MANLSNPTTNNLLTFNKEELTKYIASIQDALQAKLQSGLSIDEILESEDPFEELEPLLPQEVYPILVLAMINNIRSKTVMEAILTGLDKGIKSYQSTRKTSNE